MGVVDGVVAVAAVDDGAEFGDAAVLVQVGGTFGGIHDLVEG